MTTFASAAVNIKRCDEDSCYCQGQLLFDCLVSIMKTLFEVKFKFMYRLKSTTTLARLAHINRGKNIVWTRIEAEKKRKNRIAIFN